MMTRLLFVVCITLSICGSSTAGFYLTGAQLYWSKSDGSNFGTTNQSDYRWTTNTEGTGNANLIVTSGLVAPSSIPPASAISFALITGDYDFQFEANGFDPRFVQHLGMNLFFTDTDGFADNSYNPSALGAYAGDLTVYTAANPTSTSFDFVGSGLTIMNYVYGTSFPKANGFESFIVADQIVTVTSFNYSLVSNGAGGFKPTGSFRLSVTATPEPSAIGVGALALCGVVQWMKKRRKGKVIGKSTVT